MDYIFFSSIQDLGNTLLGLSYDAVCQYGKKIWACHDLLPHHLQIDPKNVDFETYIPKLHIKSHTAGCHTKFSLNLRPRTGCTDGEGIEQVWSCTNSAANSTKEMTEGSRHDTLNNFFGDLNYCKVLGMGT